MKTKLLEQQIEKLKLDNSIIKILNKNSIYFIKDLWILERKDLKLFKLNNNQINNIIVRMQLNGIDLKKKIYN